GSKLTQLATRAVQLKNAERANDPALDLRHVGADRFINLFLNRNGAPRVVGHGADMPGLLLVFGLVRSDENRAHEKFARSLRHDRRNRAAFDWARPAARVKRLAMNIDLLRRLTEAHGVPGQEDAIRD